MIWVNGQQLQREHFPDNTLLIKDHFPDSGEKVVISWHFEDNEELVVLLFLVRHLRADGRNRIILNMPYIPNARQDRVKSREDVFTLKYFAGIINSLEFEKVIVLDPHSYVSEALLNHIEIRYPDELVGQIAARIPEVTFFYPDEGAAKRYGQRYQYPYAFGIKARDWKTGKITGLDIAGDQELIAGKDILIMDDICSRGGTFYHSAKKLKAAGAGKIYLFVTHCENSVLEGELLTSGLIERIYTTNSICTLKHEMIKIIDIRED